MRWSSVELGTPVTVIKALSKEHAVGRGEGCAGIEVG
jgi:hypothetical protein